MKFSLNLIIKILLVFFLIGSHVHQVLGCHRGGAMGFAKKDPAMMSVDISLSPTFVFASSSGTSGCENWDYTSKLRQEYVKTQWVFLREESSKGKGDHLTAFFSMMGCVDGDQPEFNRMMKENYPELFQELGVFESKNSITFLFQIDHLVSKNNNLNCKS